jgi:hypothetical protein
MRGKISVLVFPCGARNGLEIYYALKDAVNIKLYGTTGKEDHCKFLFKNYIENAPYITDKCFIRDFNRILDKYKIDVVMPTHEDISLFLSVHLDKIHAKVAVPGLEQAKVCRSKKLTYETFKEDGFCPKVFNSLEDVKEYPVFIKPDKGQGSKGAFMVSGKEDLAKVVNEDHVISEYLPGKEFTVDCFTDRHGKLRFVGPRKRHRIEGGISVNSFVVPLTNELELIANSISEKINMRGVWFFQVKEDNKGEPKLLEIAARTAGTMNLYRGLGVNFPLLTVYDLLDIDVDIIKNDYYLEVDRALFNKYKSTLKFKMVYIDFDDTIIKEGRTNPFVMQFLYYMRNDKKKIKLITRHKGNIKKTLLEYSISEKLFDEIIVLKDNQVKSDFIKEKKDVIFIDNSFKERAQVKRELKIPVFDVDAINTLINWRE